MRMPLVVLALIVCSFKLQRQTDFFQKLAQKAVEQTEQKVTYDPAYVQLKYPGGDVPSNKGVCTDLVIRAYRGVGVDLQKEVHEDMKKRFSEYPRLWGLKSTDRNIDHRRVPNLMKFFEHKGASLKVSADAADYKPGDLVTWNLQNRKTVSGITHIGIVTDKLSPDGSRHLVAHNIGGGNVLEDMLFSYTIIGHYRYRGD